MKNLNNPYKLNFIKDKVKVNKFNQFMGMVVHGVKNWWRWYYGKIWMFLLMFILVKSFNLFMPSRRNDLNVCVQNFSLFLFFCICLIWVVINNQNHLWQCKWKCSPERIFNFFYGGTMSIDAKIPCFPYVSCLTKLTINQYCKYVFAKTFCKSGKWWSKHIVITEINEAFIYLLLLL